MTKRLLLTAILAGGLCGSALATVIDDPQIFIQQSGSTPAGGDPNIITDPSAFVVGVAGNFTLQDPLLVIVGVYNGNGVPSISYTGCAIPSACPAALVGTYGLATNVTTMVAGQDAWTQLGLAGGGSESFTNWSALDVEATLPAPTSYTLYAFQLDANLTSGSPLTIDEAGAALGSFIIAYGCEDGTGTASGCNKEGNIGQTVLTNTGFLDTNLVLPPPPPLPNPEPGSLALIGAGLAGLGFVRRRK